MTDSERFATGVEIRTEVLGEAYVTRSLANATPFNKPLQELVTEYCWGEVWSRPGIDRRTRSMLNIAMLAAMNHQTELGLHVQGAIRNGCTESEIQEVLLQTAIYCGVPTAINGFRTAQAALAQLAEADAT
jgi:4-carboxymuconolactone decarboxylase